MQRKKIVIAFDPRRPVVTQRQFLQSYFSALDSLMVGLPIGPPMAPQELRATLKAVRHSWEHPHDAGVWGMPFILHDHSVVDPDTLHRELAYADALLINRALWAQMIRLYPDYLEALACGPVIILPEAEAPLKQVVLIYDGTHESLLALREFVFLFPSLCHDADATLLIPSHGPCITGSPQEERGLMEYLQGHFHSVAMQKVCTADAHIVPKVIDLTIPTLLVGSGTHLHDPIHDTQGSPLQQFWQQPPFYEITD